MRRISRAGVLVLGGRGGLSQNTGDQPFLAGYIECFGGNATTTAPAVVPGLRRGGHGVVTVPVPDHLGALD